MMSSRIPDYSVELVSIMAAIIDTHHNGEVVITKKMLQDISGCRITMVESFDQSCFKVKVLDGNQSWDKVSFTSGDRF